MHTTIVRFVDLLTATVALVGVAQALCAWVLRRAGNRDPVMRARIMTNVRRGYYLDPWEGTPPRLLVGSILAFLWLLARLLTP